MTTKRQRNFIYLTKEERQYIRVSRLEYSSNIIHLPRDIYVQKEANEIYDWILYKIEIGDNDCQDCTKLTRKRTFSNELTERLKTFSVGTVIPFGIKGKHTAKALKILGDILKRDRKGFKYTKETVGFIEFKRLGFQDIRESNKRG